MEIVDELMTPGCPQCAVKHLSAALYHRAMIEVANEQQPPSEALVCVCIASINLVEVLNGYKSHLWYAVGALERAEECAFMARSELRTAREARLILEEHGLAGVRDALYHIGTGTCATHAEWISAHLVEAMRELPAMAHDMAAGDLIGSIERIRKEYFIPEEAPAASTEDAEKGGEPDMATKKKIAVKAPVKKADAKAAKAACKGGKCKGGKCK